MENSNCLISYIIPAYNAEVYIERCVDSIVSANSINNYEIIIIENGSTDNTTSVCEALTANNENILLFHSDKGVSNARNKGIKVANGQWIFFVDADDQLITDNYSKIDKDATDLRYDIYLYGHQAGAKTIYKCTSEHESYSANEQLEYFTIIALKNPTVYLPVWGKLFKREIIIKNNIRFDSDLKFAEDSHFTLQYLKYVKSICVSNDIIYKYSVDTPSAMRGNATDKFKEYLKSLTKTKQIFEKENQQLQHAFSFYVIMHLNIVMVRTVFSVYNKQPLTNKMQVLKMFCNTSVINNAIKDIKLTECTKISMVPCLFIKIHCPIFAALIFRVRAVQNYRKEK